MQTPVSHWIAFNVAVLFLLVLDLFVLHRKEKVISTKAAAGWSLFWVALSLSFCFWIWQSRGDQAGQEFLTGYLIEYTLSVDNIFVFIVLLSYFKVPAHLQHGLLFWGVLGAAVMRGVLIGLGVSLVHEFNWILYIFGAFLLFTGVKLFFHKQDDEYDPSNNFILKFATRHLPLTKEYHGPKFMIRQGGKIFFTPLALVLVMVETTDLMFALDSIPAVFAVTQDPYIAYTSNICAVLGLRALYFVLADSMNKFAFLQAGLAVVLTFIGIKILLHDLYPIETHISLIIVLAVLATAICTSIMVSRSRPPSISNTDSSGSHNPPPSDNKTDIQLGDTDAKS